MDGRGGGALGAVARRRRPSRRKPPRPLPIGNGCATTCNWMSICRKSWPPFPATTRRCKPPCGRAPGCVCCGRSRGNVWPHLFVPPANRSRKSEQIIALLSRRFGEPLPVPPEKEPAYSFPGYARLAAVSESDLRGCKLGFRAPYLRGTAQKLAAGEVDLAGFPAFPGRSAGGTAEVPGVGVKIADCVLLFAYGFPEAFPVDVWIMRALRRHYFPRRSVSPARLRRFIRAHFGPQAGYAQQYCFITCG